MARPFYPYEASDPDLDWLVSGFLSGRPDFLLVDAAGLPLLLIPIVLEKGVESDASELPR